MSDDTKNLLNALERTPAEIAELLSAISPHNINFRPSAEEFSILESVCHLRDIEVEGYSVRIRRLLEEDNPQLEDIDGAQLAALRDYNSQRLEQALQEFKTARMENVELLRTVDQHDLGRRGNLEGTGEITVRSLIAMMAQHDEDHIDDLRRARRLLRSDT